MRQNLRGEDRDVVASVGLSGNVERLLGVLRELLEEESQKSVDVLASSDSVANRVVAVGETDVNGLVKEDDRCVCVP